MEKHTVLWSVRDLRRKFPQISFPEYQREPSIWSKAAKQRLIDSVVRAFDIASLYVYQGEDGGFECIDGRQRIGALMAFVGESPDNEHNNFEFKIANEIFDDENHPFASLVGARFHQIQERADQGRDPTALAFIDRILDYRLTIVLLARVDRAEEFNLQFTRLNLGTIINSGEKLNAMIGDIRNVCFERLKDHPFLQAVGIPTRRYAKEQLAAQAMLQIFSFKLTGEYTRARHFDLQRFFKENADLDEPRQQWVEDVIGMLDLLGRSFDEAALLRSRAIAVSVVLLAWRLGLRTEAEGGRVAKFMDEFICRVSWQVQKGRELDADGEYRYLFDFQRHVTQASVEKAAVTNRAVLLEREWEAWRARHAFTGDAAFRKRTGIDPSEACRMGV
jgi:hypothetical protein